MRFGSENLSFAQPDSPQGIGTWSRLKAGFSSSDRLVNPLYAFDRPGKFRKESRRVHEQIQARHLPGLNLFIGCSNGIESQECFAREVQPPSSPGDPGYGVSAFFLALLTKRPRNAREAAVRGRGNVTRERQRL